MNLTNRGRLYLLIAFLSAFFSYLIFTFNYFPHFGFSLSLVIFTILSFKIKNDKNEVTFKYFIFTLSFSLFLMIRSEGFITFLNLSSTLFFGSLMLTSNRKNKLGFIEHATTPFVLIFKSVLQKSKYYLELEVGRSNNEKKIFENVLVVFITVILVAVIVPLLSFSNPIFEKSVKGIWEFLNFSRFFILTMNCFLFGLSDLFSFSDFYL